MYVNERDQINYHGFLRALREMNKVSQEAVSKGICTVSGMNRFENGNRLAEKLMRDRLTARLGISGEKYEDYLQPKEYVRWEHRLRIVKAIEERNLALAKRELMAYEELPGLNCVNKQFAEAMRFVIMSLEGASEEELITCIKKAVKCTVSNADKALSGLHLLADQEVNLIAEQMRLTPPKKVVKDVTAWRISEYEKLIAYMENSCWEKLQKAKVYPKVVYYICQLLLEDTPDEAACRRGLELCHNAIELLRDTSRLYYFIELTESRRKLSEHLMIFDIPDSEKSELEEMLKDNNAWEKVFKELYEEYKVAPYMSDFCYLYYETECHNMVEVIETRRKMLGLSRMKLGEGICTDRTIIRFEREGRNPSIDLVRALFDKMGLCAEYRRARVITNDVEELLLATKLVSFVNRYDTDGMEECIRELRKTIRLDMPHNQQEIIRNENQVLLFRRKIKPVEYYKIAQKALECTIPLSAVLDCDKLYLTKTEIRCVLDLGFVGNGADRDDCKDIIKGICLDIFKNNKELVRISELEFMTEYLESDLGNCGQYESSTNLSNKMLKECLIYRRMVNIATNLYNILWNQEQQLREENVAMKKEYLINSLSKCILLYKLVREYNTAAFYQNKLNDVEKKC